MVSGGCLVGHAAQGIGAPAPGAVVAARGSMTGLSAGATVSGAFFVFVAVVGPAVPAPLHQGRPEGRPPCLRTGAGTRPDRAGPGTAKRRPPPPVGRGGRRTGPDLSPVHRADATD